MANPNGKSWFRNSYAHGLALIMDYNYKYIDELEIDDETENFKLP